jgi:hypothetical protein
LFDRLPRRSKLVAFEILLAIDGLLFEHPMTGLHLKLSAEAVHTILISSISHAGTSSLSRFG